MHLCFGTGYSWCDASHAKAWLQPCGCYASLHGRESSILLSQCDTRRSELLRAHKTRSQAESMASSAYKTTIVTLESVFLVACCFLCYGAELYLRTSWKTLGPDMKSSYARHWVKTKSKSRVYWSSLGRLFTRLATSRKARSNAVGLPNGDVLTGDTANEKESKQGTEEQNEGSNVLPVANIVKPAVARRNGFPRYICWAPFGLSC